MSTSGGDIVILKQVINLLTSEWIDHYEQLDYFVSMEDFKEYVEWLNSLIPQVPECWKYDD